MINRVILTGRPTDNPQIRITPNSKVASFTLAVNRRFQQANQPQTDFIRCVAFGKLADFVEQYIPKGMLIGVDGRIQTGSYDDPQSGRRIYTTDVVCESIEFLEPKRTQSNSYQQPNYNNNAYQSAQSTSQDSFSIDANAFAQEEPSFEEDSLEIASDDLPF